MMETDITGPELWSIDDLSDEDRAAWETGRQADEAAKAALNELEQAAEIYWSSPEGQQVSRDIDEMLMAGLDPINFSRDPRADLACTRWRVANGRALGEHDKELILAAIDGAPLRAPTGGRGRPETNLSPLADLHRRVDVYFYRKLLPNFNGTTISQEELAGNLGLTIKTVRKLEKEGFSGYVYNLSKQEIPDRVHYLLKVNKLAGVHCKEVDHYLGLYQLECETRE